jgi:DNA-directed RNA polymerase subunit RPC12/RpoP
VKPEDVTTSPYGRGTCAQCGREFNLLKSGKVRHHADFQRDEYRCEGAGKWPKGAS